MFRIRFALTGALAALLLAGAATTASAQSPNRPDDPQMNAIGWCVGKGTASNARFLGVTPAEMAQFFGVNAGEFQMIVFANCS